MARMAGGSTLENRVPTREVVRHAWATAERPQIGHVLGGIAGLVQPECDPAPVKPLRSWLQLPRVPHGRVHGWCGRRRSSSACVVKASHPDFLPNVKARPAFYPI